VRRTAVALALLAALAPAAAAHAAAPPWCGTPEPDAAANLDPSEPGAFPHIPYYAVGCTLRGIAARSHGRMHVRVIGTSAIGRDLYGVVINRLRTRAERRDDARWRRVRARMLSDPLAAQRLARRFGDRIKVPVLIQGGTHGDEYEGVDAAIDTIERLATTPYGEDRAVDAVLDHLIVVFNPVQNPDGRVLGQRANGDGFDLNRDFLTQSQPETIAAIRWMRRWLAPDMLDMHGYRTPTLIEGTTKPHNPGIEYDHWLEWNQARTAFNKAALAAIGQDVERPIDDWDHAEGWDDWGPFYGAMYQQHIGLNASTVEMCATRACGGRSGARRVQNTVQRSTLEFVATHRAAMLADELSNYGRGDLDAPRPVCCRAPFGAAADNWMHDYPQAYVIPFGAGQRSDAEANRLVEWLLFNGIEVERLDRGQGRFGAGSYVVWMAQPHRGLADTALGIGVDVSPRIRRLYAPPAAWSHGYLWGADVATIPDGARFAPRTTRILRPNRLHGGAEPGPARSYALALDSPTAVRALNAVVGAGVPASLARGAAVFGAAARGALDRVGRARGLTFTRRATPPPAGATGRVPRVAVLTSAADQCVWVLRQLGFVADAVSTQRIDTASADPLAGYDVIFNPGSGYPPGKTARDRLEAFLARGGGYVGAQTAGARFLADGGQVTGLAAADRGGNGRSGIVYWENPGRSASPITGAYPARDTAIVDPPTWLTAVPPGFVVDARLPRERFFAAGLWPGAATGGAPGAAIVAHGPNAARTANLVVFANNPLYRADPEREWPMAGAALYWSSSITDTPR
jgi:predicted deacylase